MFRGSCRTRHRLRYFQEEILMAGETVSEMKLFWLWEVPITRPAENEGAMRRKPVPEFLVLFLLA